MDRLKLFGWGALGLAVLLFVYVIFAGGSSRTVTVQTSSGDGTANSLAAAGEEDAAARI